MHHIVKVAHESPRIIKRICKPVQQGLFFVEARGEYADRLASAFHQGRLTYSRFARGEIMLDHGHVTSEPEGLI